jgi:DNA-binding phage protein
VNDEDISVTFMLRFEQKGGDLAMKRRSAFWEDLESDLQDEGFRREYLLETLRVQTIDSIVNALDEARVGLGWSKAQLARAVDAEPAVVRRLFSAKGNPTLSTLAEIAGAVGLRISLEPLPHAEAKLLVGDAPVHRARKQLTRR